MNKQTITSICSVAALSAAMISPAYAGITETTTSLIVDFNDASDHTSNDTFKRFGSFTHNPTGGIASDGALVFPSNYQGINWKQGLTGGIGTVITQSLVFTANNLADTNPKAVPFVMGFTNNVDSHVGDPTAPNNSYPTADAFQLQIYHDLPNTRINTTLKNVVDGTVDQQKYANFAYTGTNMLQFDLSLTRTGTNSYDWGYVLTDLGADGSGSSLLSSNTQSITTASSDFGFGSALDGGGIYAAMRSGNQASGQLNGVDSWSVNVNAVPEPSAYALLAGALALGLVMIRRRRS